MTTPNKKDAPEGAYTIGGGQFRFGQEFDESLITDIWDIAHPSPAELRNPFALGGALSDGMKGILGGALGKLPFEALRKFEPWVLDPPDEQNPDRPTEFVDENDAIDRILAAFKPHPLKDIVDGIIGGGGGSGGSGGGTGTPGEKVKDFFDTVQENVETLKGMSAPGNQVLSPNFEISLIQRIPYGTPQLGYTTSQHRLGLHSLRITTTDSAYQGVYLAPGQKDVTFAVRPGDMFNCGVQVKADASNVSGGNVRLVMRWTSGGVIVSDVESDLVPNNSALKADWVDLEVSATAPATADELRVFVICSPDMPVGSQIYVDAAYVREKTIAQTIIDNIHYAVDGGSASTQQKPQTVSERLKSAWGKFVDGLRGHSQGTTGAALPDDVYNAAAGVNSVANTADLNAGLAQDAADQAALDAAKAAEDAYNAALIAADPQTYNLLTNPGFNNTSINLVSFATGSDPDPNLTYSSARVHKSANSVKTIGSQSVDLILRLRTLLPPDHPDFNNPQPGDPYSFWWWTTTPVNPGDKYYAEVWCWNESTNVPTVGNVDMRAFFYDRAFEAPGQQYVDQLAVLDNTFFGAGYVGTENAARFPKGQWTKLWGYFTVPAGAYAMSFRLTAAPQLAGGGYASNVYYWAEPLLMRAEAKAAMDAAQAALDSADSAAADASAAGTVSAAAVAAVEDTNTALFGGIAPAATILTTAVPNLPAAKITSGTLSTSVLPAGTGAVGSGFLIRKTSGTINVDCTANTVTPNMFKTSDFPNPPNSTSDYTISTGSNGELKVTAANAGWYMVEVSFGIKQQTRVVGYRIAPLLYVNGSPSKVGSTVDYDGSLNARIPFSAQASFIVYLNTGEYVTPGAALNSQSTISGLDIIGTNFAQDTYFSVSLLNRSLA